VILGASLVGAKRKCCLNRHRVWKNRRRAKFMNRVLLATFVLLLVSFTLASPLDAAEAPKPVSLSSVVADPQAERLLLEMANQARARAGLAPLRMDEGLAEAAREHALEQAEQQRISHQLPGEPGLAQRLSKSTALHLQRGGENVASAGSVSQAHQSLMASPPHRENLLDPSFNVAGFGVVRSGHLLYVTQDFGRGVKTYSAEHSEQLIARTIINTRRQTRLAGLNEFDGTPARNAACRMADENTIKTRLSREMKQSTYLVRYTSHDLETLPPGATRAIADSGVHSFAVGSCYRQTKTYPNGVYWVALMFY